MFQNSMYHASMVDSSIRIRNYMHMNHSQLNDCDMNPQARINDLLAK